MTIEAAATRVAEKEITRYDDGLSSGGYVDKRPSAERINMAGRNQEAASPSTKVSESAAEKAFSASDSKEAWRSEGRIDGLAVAKAISKLNEKGTLKAEHWISLRGLGKKLIDRMMTAVSEATGLSSGSYVLNPDRRTTNCPDKVFFISLPEKSYSTNLDWAERALFGTRYLFVKIVRYLQGISRKTKTETVVITADWRAPGYNQWSGNFKQIKQNNKLSFFLTHGGKATQLRFEPSEVEDMDGGRQRKSKAGKYRKTARALTEILDSWKADNGLESEDVKDIITKSTGIEPEKFSLHPSGEEAEPRELAFFLNLSGWQHISRCFDNSDFYTGFGDTLMAMVAHMQGRGRNITKEAVLITDCWDSEEYDFWKHNLKAISEEANLEVYLYAVREPNLIEI